jgi:hypothetical protein
MRADNYASLPLICRCLERTGKVKCMTLFLLRRVSEESFTSTETGTSFLLMEPRWFRAGTPFVGPMC